MKISRLGEAPDYRFPSAERSGTATGAYVAGLVSHAAGIRGVNGVSRQAPLASGGVLVLGVNQRSGDSGGDSLALYPES